MAVLVLNLSTMVALGEGLGCAEDELAVFVAVGAVEPLAVGDGVGVTTSTTALSCFNRSQSSGASTESQITVDPIPGSL